MESHPPSGMLSVVLAGCAAKDFSRPLPTTSSVDLSRYAGTRDEIARYRHGSAELRDRGGRISPARIKRRQRQGRVSHDVKRLSSDGTATVVDRERQETAGEECLKRTMRPVGYCERPT